MARQNIARGFRVLQNQHGDLYGGLTFPILLRVSSVKTGSETTVFYCDSLNDLGKSIAELADVFNTRFAIQVLQATNAGNEGLIRKIADTVFEGAAVSAGNGGNCQLTVGTAFPSALAAGDSFLLAPTTMLEQGGWVKGTTDTSPLTSQDLFSITGLVRVHEIFGVVKTGIQNQATTVQLKFDPDDGGADVNLDAGLYDANAIAVGTLIRWTGDLSDALAAEVDVVEAPSFDAPATGVIMYAGDIKVVYGAASTGVIDWYARYEPIDGDLVAG